MIEEIKDKKHFEELRKKSFLMVLFYTETSPRSLEALKVLDEFKRENKDVPLYAINASKLRDIHPLYGVNTVPTVLVLKNGRVSKVVHGLQRKQFYEMLLYEAPFRTRKDEGRKTHRVIVYTSSSCPWCNAVKTYLAKHRIPFREVDISQDERAAQELVRKSGQMGVPQVDIDGKIVVGFDKAKLNALLQIKERE